MNAEWAGRRGQSPMKSGRLQALAAVVLCLVAGCKAPQDVGPGHGPDVSSDAYFTDVPVPEGFELVEPAFIYEGTHRRIGQLKYRGEGDVLDFVRYYRKSMVAHGWGLIVAMGGSERMDMSFGKKSEVCDICIEESRWSTLITIQVGEDERSSR